MTALRNFLRIMFKVLFAAFFIVGGINHFWHPDLYLRMMPPWIPFHLFMVYASGVAEVVLGAGLLIHRFTRYAAWGLIALLVAIFPANLYMALNPSVFPELSPAGLWWRLPFQILFIAWAYAYTKDGAPMGAASEDHKRDLEHKHPGSGKHHGQG